MHRFAIVVFLMVLFCAVASSFSATIHVPSQQPTIQAGINAAVNGDTVLVAPGEYVEFLTYLGKEIVVKSEKGPDSTALLPPNSNQAHIRFVGAEESAAILEGFTIKGTNLRPAIYCENSSPTIQYNEFTDHISSNQDASILRVTGSSHALFRYNLFYRNPSAWAVIWSDADSINFINNTICESIRGLVIYSQNSIILNNIVTKCSDYGFFNQSTPMTREYNNIWGNHVNYAQGMQPDPLDISVNPGFRDTSLVNYMLVGTSPCIDAGDPSPQYLDPDVSRNDIGAFWIGRARRKLLVPGEFATIQSAIDSSINGDTVQISPGVHSGTGNCDIIVDGRRILITGTSSPSLTVVDCSGVAHRTNSGFITRNLDSLTVIANLEIRNASIGIMVEGECPKIHHVRLDDCVSAIYVTYAEGKPVRIIDCVLQNSNYGIFFEEESNNVVIDSCLIQNNAVGVFTSYSTFRCTNTELRGNATAFTSSSGSNRGAKIFDSCYFDENGTALRGAFTVRNSVITNSQKAIHCPFYNECTLENVTITGTTEIVVSADLEGAPRQEGPVSAASMAQDYFYAAVEMKSCSLVNNLSTLIHVSGLDADIQTIGMERCYIANNGGGIQIRGVECSIKMIECSYVNNSQSLSIAFPNPRNSQRPIIINNCTFAQNANSAIEIEINDYSGILSVPIEFENNLIFGNGGIGLRIIEGTADSAFNYIPHCCNSFANLGGNYSGITDPTGINNNISVDPEFCDVESGDFHIAVESPCAPQNNSCNLLIGALSPMCTFVPAVYSISIENESLTNVLSPTPKIQWAVSQPVPSPQDSFLIAVGTDNDWQFAEKWNPAPFASADTFVTYDGSALQDGQTYYLRLRVHNTLAWSEWYQTSFRMNSVPTSPTLRAPTNLAFVGSTPTLWVTNGTDAEADPLTYEFAGFHDTDCVAGPAIDLIGVASGVDSTGGQIVDPLAENCRYWWRARAFDGYEYSAWTSYAQFMVNGTPEAPATPTLDYPPLPDNKPIFTLLPTLSWQVSHDPDPGDTVRYKLELSDRANFSFALVRDSLVDVNLPLVDSLVFGTHYYWRVTAKDKSGLSALSGVKEFWTWKLGDVNHSHSTDLSDLSLLIAYLTQTPRPDISPKMVADLTGDCKIDLSDLSTMVAFMTTTGVQLQVGCE